MSETVKGFCLDAKNAYEGNRLYDAIEALESAIALVDDDILAQEDNKRKAIDTMEKGAGNADKT